MINICRYTYIIDTFIFLERYQDTWRYRERLNCYKSRVKKVKIWATRRQLLFSRNEWRNSETGVSLIVVIITCTHLFSVEDDSGKRSSSSYYYDNNHHEMKKRENVEHLYFDVLCMTYTLWRRTYYRYYIQSVFVVPISKFIAIHILGLVTNLYNLHLYQMSKYTSYIARIKILRLRFSTTIVVCRASRLEVVKIILFTSSQ